jgi:hypothetical protein
MDFDSIIKWITETLPTMLSIWFEAYIAFAKLLWGKIVIFVSVWFDISVAFFKQAWENFPALMSDWGKALSEFAKGLRKSFPEILPESILPVLESVPDWALFIVVPLTLVFLLVFVLKKIFTESEKPEKHLKSVESPEVPTFGNPLPAERAFVEEEHKDDADTPGIPEPERVDPVIRMESFGRDDPDPMERQAPTITRELIEDEVLHDDVEELQAPTTIGPTELQTRIREQLGIDDEIAEPSDQDETETEASDAENLLDTSAEHDVSVSLNRIRGLRSDSEPRTANLNITGISEGDSTAQVSSSEQNAEEPAREVLLEPLERPEEAAAGPLTENAPPPQMEQLPPDVPLAAMSPDVAPAGDEDDDEDDLPGTDETETPVSSGVPATPGPLLATIARLEKGLQVNVRLAAQDPANAQTQRDVAISQSRLADAMVEAGDLANAIPRFEQSLTISERLAEQNPLSAEALRDVAVSLNRLGDALANTGDIAGATVQYEMSLTVSQRIAEQSSANAQAQRDVWISLNRMGDVRSKAGNIDAAIAHFKTGMQISKRLADFNPANVEAQRDLIVSYAKLAEVSPGQGWWAKGLAVCEPLVVQGKLQPADSWMLEDLRRRSAADVSL